MSFFPYSFEGSIATYAFKRYAYVVVFLPKRLQRELPFDVYPRLRIVGEVADHPISGAWQPSGKGRHYLLLSKRFLRQAELSVGDPVEVRFAIASQAAVDVPSALTDALSRNQRLAAAWAALTPGAQRAFAHRVAIAKAPATQQKRVREVLDMIAEGRRPGASAKRKRTSP